MKKVALSTDNKNKVKEMLAILSKFNFEIVTKGELGVNEEFEEILLQVQREISASGISIEKINRQESIDVIYAYLNPDIKINGYEI